MSIKILVADKEPMMCEVFSYVLEKAGFLAVKAADGVGVLGRIQNEQPQLLILDAALPGISSPELCKLISDHEVRNRMPHAPVFILCEDSGDESRASALDAGADDCLAKPFRMREFMARVDALLRRSGISSGNPAEDAIHDGGVSLYTERRQVVVQTDDGSGRCVTLTQKECELLGVLMAYKGHVVSREQLLDQVWGDRAGKLSGEKTTLDVHIGFLRQKLETDPKNPKYLVNIRSKGYIFKG